MISKHPYIPAPTHAGAWLYYDAENASSRTVIVTETPTSGRRCDELRMGGSSECGYATWSGMWLPKDANRISPKT